MHDVLQELRSIPFAAGLVPYVVCSFNSLFVSWVLDLNACAMSLSSIKNEVEECISYNVCLNG